MQTDHRKGKAARGLVRNVSFMAMGAGALANPLAPVSPYTIGFGLAWGLLFGGLYRLLLNGFLNLFNGNLKKATDRYAVTYAVDSGMLFLTPFSVMLLIAVFALGWNTTIPFVTAGIMAVSTACIAEMHKLRGKAGLLNTIAAVVISNGFSLIWTLSFSYVNRVPAMLEEGLRLALAAMGGGAS